MAASRMEAVRATAATGNETGTSSCSAARDELLGSVGTVNKGDVKVLSTAGTVNTLYIDATGGGIDASANSAWMYVDLGASAKAQVTDKTSVTSTAWDLAFKRPVIYTNSGDGGPGQGGAVLITKDFDSVTAADATGATFNTEKFFDAQCNPFVDPTGSALTTFSAWYDYDQSTHVLTPAAGTWLVHGGTGKLL